MRDSLEDRVGLLRELVSVTETGRRMIAPGDPWRDCTAREALEERTMRIEGVLTGPDHEHATEEGTAVRLDNKWWLVPR